MDKCILCEDVSVTHLGQKRILNKYDVNYFQCRKCGLIFTEKPYWLQEAYSSAICMTDTGAVERNLQCAEGVSFIVKRYYKKIGKVLDYGGGYGIFVRLMRDRGYDFCWYDKFAEPLMCRGFEWNNEKVSLITSFECFEHMDSPAEDIERMFSISNNIIFSTDLYSDGFEVKGDKWWYYCFEHGQHIAFYSKKTLEYLADKYNVNYYQLCGYHWFTDKKISRNSLYLTNFIWSKVSKFSKVNFKYCSIDYADLRKRIMK